jgi:Peptidase family M28
MRADMEYLAGNLHHRGANTESERSAAEYIHERLRACSPDASIDDFYATGVGFGLFAAYYAEFAFAALLALWWPWVFFAYGIAVTLAYMAELTGYNVFARFLPHYETQNVSARFLAARPKGLIVVTAHYDSPKSCPLTDRRDARWLRAAHALVVLCMTAVIVSCAAQGLDLCGEAAVRVDLIIRFGAVGVLLAVGSALLLWEWGAEYSRGANDNASGVAVLLALAERLRDEPPEEADVWLVATGSQSAWYSGMRQFLASHELDRDSTRIINVDSVGEGGLRYVTGEGLIHVFRCDKELVALARDVAKDHRAQPHRNTAFPTDLLLPLARGYKALGITAVTPPDAQRERETSDRAYDIDYGTLQSAAEFTEAIVRGVAGRSLTPPEDERG